MYQNLEGLFTVGESFQLQRGNQAMKHNQFIFLALVAVSGCSKINQLTAVNCSNDKGVEVTKSLISDEVQKEFLEVKKSDGTPVFDPAAVRATISKLQISLENIRTSKTDPNSTKIFCEATYKVSIPADLYRAVNDGIKMQDSDSDPGKVASKYGFTVAANVFSREISYSLQPTDDQKSIFSETSDAKNPADFLSDIISSALAKPMLEAKRSDEQRAAEQAAAQAKAAADQEEQQRLQQQQAALESARQDNLLAKNTLNQFWSVIPKERQDEIASAQTAWVQKKKIDCQLESASKSTDPIQNEIDRLICDTSRIKDRIAELHQSIN